MRLLMIFALFVPLSLFAESQGMIAGYNLSEIGTFGYDANENEGGEKTSAQLIVDQLAALHVRHLVLNPRAFMRDPRSSEIIPATPAGQRAEERRRYGRLIKYIHGKGMTVGIRPILFVVDEKGNPYQEKLPDGTIKHWWHGNIQPADPNKWFESFRTYLDGYALIAKANKVSEFTLGAELYSMTVGIEDQWKEFPYGLPGRWLELLRYLRPRLAPNTRIMYDINFTDATVNTGAIQAQGGELERWRYRLVDLANPTDPAQNEIWQTLVTFWQELDAIGIDMYRSLASGQSALSANLADLQALLKDTSDRYASQLDNTLAEIETITGTSKKIILKEIGFRSVEKGFIEPFTWDDTRSNSPVNIEHQAVATAAILQSFWQAGWDWFQGVYFWDVTVDPSRHGPQDKSFSPLGKKATEDVLRHYFRP